MSDNQPTSGEKDNPGGKGGGTPDKPSAPDKGGTGKGTDTPSGPKK